MRQYLHLAVSEWLRHENEDRDWQAEESLRGVFAHLPEEPLPAGFAERILARAGLAPIAAPAQPWAAVWTLRATLSLSLALGALFLMLLPGYLPSLLGIVHPGRVAEIGVTALVGFIERLSFGLVFWRILSDVGAVLASAVSSPAFMAAAALSIVLSVSAFRLLHGLVVSERSSYYVGSA